MLNILYTWIGIMLTILSAMSCGYEPMSFGKPSIGAGMNGGFEKTRPDLPVNWAFYGSKAYKNQQYQILLDRNEYTEGTQSLCFDVDTIQNTRYIWKNPGLLQTYRAIPGESYRIRFTYRNNGCHFRASIGSEKSRGAHQETLKETKESTLTWKTVEYSYTVPEEYRTIRFELSILSPGQFWIDDIRIEGNTDKKERKLWGIWLGL